MIVANCQNLNIMLISKRKKGLKYFVHLDNSFKSFGWEIMLNFLPFTLKKVYKIIQNMKIDEKIYVFVSFFLNLAVTKRRKLNFDID